MVETFELLLPTAGQLDRFAAAHAQPLGKQMVGRQLRDLQHGHLDQIGGSIQRSVQPQLDPTGLLGSGKRPAAGTARSGKLSGSGESPAHLLLHPVDADFRPAVFQPKLSQYEVKSTVGMNLNHVLTFLLLFSHPELFCFRRWKRPVPPPPPGFHHMA